MINTENIFRYRQLDERKLSSYGFSAENGVFIKKFPLAENFDMAVKVSKAGVIFNVYDNDSEEEYVLVNIEGAQGGFVAEIREKCEKILLDVAEKCFTEETFKTQQTKRLVEYIEKKYSVEPEYLWDDLPRTAVFRHDADKKWFAIIMTVARKKILKEGEGNIEVVNFKNTPDFIAENVDGERIFSAYHMNKKHWFTVCLDGRISDEMLFSLVDISFRLTIK